MLARTFIFSILTFSSSTLANTAYFELPVVLSTYYTPAKSTELKPGIGLGFTHFPFQYESLRFGYGGQLTLSPLFWQGTNDVYTTGFETDLETRGYFAYAFDGTNISFWPYFYAGPNLGARFTKLSIYGSRDSVFLGDLGFRSGIGLMVRFADMAVKLDTSVGYAISGLNLHTWIMFSYGIF